MHSNTLASVALLCQILGWIWINLPRSPSPSRPSRKTGGQSLCPLSSSSSSSSIPARIWSRPDGNSYVMRFLSWHLWRKRNTLPETDSSHLKIDDWKASFLLGWPGYVSFRECTPNQPDETQVWMKKTSLITGESPNHRGLIMWHMQIMRLIFLFMRVSFFHKCQISQDLFQKTNPQHLLYQQPFKSWPPLNPINDLCSWLNWPPIWGIHPFQLGRKPTHGFLRFVNSLPPAWKISNPNAMHSSMPRHNYPQVKHGCFTVQP